MFPGLSAGSPDFADCKLFFRRRKNRNENVPASFDRNKFGAVHMTFEQKGQLYGSCRLEDEDFLHKGCQFEILKHGDICLRIGKCNIEPGIIADRLEPTFEIWQLFCAVNPEEVSIRFLR